MVVLAKCQLYPDLFVQESPVSYNELTDHSYVSGNLKIQNGLVHGQIVLTCNGGKFIVLMSSNGNIIVYDKNNHCVVQIQTCTDKRVMVLALCGQRLT